MSEQVSYRQFSGTAAENYERYFVPAVATPVAPDLLAAADLQPGERVLDLACGTGIIARLAAERVGPTGTVVGVDVAPDMIDAARSAPAPAGAEIEWRQGDAGSLALPDASFDVVVSQMGLMFVEDKPGALAECRRVLAPGGRIAISTPGTVQPAFEIMEDALVRHIGPQLAGFVQVVFSMNDPAELQRLLTEAGFVRVETVNPTTVLRLPPPAEFLWQYINLTPMGPVVGGAPDDAQAALEEDVVAGWQEFVEDGSTVIHQPMVIATGRT